ncbi:MAG: PRC-barrel domain-containing protein, partial [Chloroflexota bacterium]
MMQIAFGAPVTTADGVQIGTADKMIFNPASGQTEKVVVHKGHLFGRDVAIDLGRVRAAAPEGVQLALTRQQVEQLPDFYASDYQLPPTTWIPPYDWPAGGVLWAGALGAAYPMMPPVETVHAAGPHTERDDVVVEAGTTVLA